MLPLPAHLEVVDSTNAEMLRLLKNGAVEDGVCIFADYQTAGKGRLKRHWQSEAAKNLLASWWLEFSGALEQMEGFSLIVGLAIVDYLKSLNVRATVKWPNDVLWHGRKLCGILVRAVTGYAKNGLIIGAGINIEQAPLLAERMAQPVALSEIMESVPTRENMALNLSRILTEQRNRWVNGEKFAQFNEWLANCDHINKEIYLTIDGNRKKLAVALGLGNRGQLLAKVDGQMQEIWTGDILQGE